MLEIKSYSFRYSLKGDWVLRDVTLSLPSGKVGVLLGPNGVGKSTLLQAILGNRKGEGEILIDGSPVSKRKSNELSRLVAYVPQNASSSPLSVYETVMLGRLPHFAIAPEKKDRDVVEKILSDMGLSSLAERSVQELSGGERQKVAIARALAQEAKLILFDEPTANLDIANALLIGAEVRRLAKEKGVAILIAIHDIHLAASLGDLFYLLKDGTIFASGGEEILHTSSLSSLYGVPVEVGEKNHKKFFIFGGNDS